jgi:hypothetical protein
MKVCSDYAAPFIVIILQYSKEAMAANLQEQHRHAVGPPGEKYSSLGFFPLGPLLAAGWWSVCS